MAKKSTTDVTKIEVPDTSVDFDTCLGFTDTQYKKSDLSEFLGLDIVPETVEDAEASLHNHLGWRDHWKGVPEYESEHKKNFKQVIVTFSTEADFLEFQKVIGQEMTMKTKSIFFPKKEKAKMSLLRFIDEAFEADTAVDLTDNDGEE